MIDSRVHTSPIQRRKISDDKFRVFQKCFCVDCTALQTSILVGVNRNTAQRYLSFFRTLVLAAAWKEREAYEIGNGVEVDESYFGPKRQRGKRGRGASKKVIVFGLLKRSGKVCTQVISRASQAEILPIIQQTVQSGSDIYSDGWRSYDALGIYGYNHKKVKHHENEFTDGDRHMNGIESFWSWTKHRLNKFHGFTRDQFVDFLLESEWRCNHRHDMTKQLQTFIKRYKVSGVI